MAKKRFRDEDVRKVAALCELARDHNLELLVVGDTKIVRRQEPQTFLTMTEQTPKNPKERDDGIDPEELALFGAALPTSRMS